jgi:hypothetical protein
MYANVTLKEQYSNAIFPMPAVWLILLEDTEMIKPTLHLKNGISKFYLNVRSILYNHTYIETTVMACYVHPKAIYWKCFNKYI